MSLKIMVVDDDSDVLKVIRAMLERLDCEVVTFADSQEAASRLEREKFDGIFLDARMPSPDGFELAKAVRASHSNSRVPVVMLTGYDDAETMREGFKSGITFFLGKPFTKERVASLFKVLRGPMLRERRRYARLPYSTAVQCTTAGKRFQCLSINLSEGGMLLDEAGGLEVGQEVGLDFSVPSCRRSLHTQAKVQRKEPPNRIAVLFHAIERDVSEVVQNFIAEGVQA